MAELDYNYIGELVTRAKSGDSDAFAELYISTYQKQYLFSYSYLKDEYLAQDALQETYVTALKNLFALKDGKLFVSWLNQINFRICYNLSHKQRKYQQEMSQGDADAAIEPAAREPGPEEVVIDSDNKKYLLQQVMALPYSESQVIMLHYYTKLKIEDIAYIMDVSKSTVKRYLDSGKKRLAKVISR